MWETFGKTNVTSYTLLIPEDSLMAKEDVCAAVMALDSTKPWSVIIKRTQSKRSLGQNSLFHHWCYVIANSTGDDTESVKAVLKDMYLPIKVATVGNTSRMVRVGTSNLSIAEFAEFMDKVSGFAASQLGITLPTTEQIS